MKNCIRRLSNQMKWVLLVILVLLVLLSGIVLSSLYMTRQTISTESDQLIGVTDYHVTKSDYTITSAEEALDSYTKDISTEIPSKGIVTLEPVPTTSADEELTPTPTPLPTPTPTTNPTPTPTPTPEPSPPREPTPQPNPGDGFEYIFDRPQYSHNLGSIVPSEPNPTEGLVIDGSKYLIENVPNIHQMPIYPTGCEAVSLTMLLQWAGYDITVDQVIDHMPKGPMPYEIREGVLFAADPREAFVGNPYTDSSYGIYHQPLLKMLSLYFPGKEVNLTGETFDEIEEQIKRGIPVVIWCTLNMERTRPSYQWETPSGEVFQWLRFEHTVTMVGFDDNHVYVINPYTGNLEVIDKNIFINSWESMYSQAISIVGA